MESAGQHVNHRLFAIKACIKCWLLRNGTSKGALPASIPAELRITVCAVIGVSSTTTVNAMWCQSRSRSSCKFVAVGLGASTPQGPAAVWVVLLLLLLLLLLQVWPGATHYPDFLSTDRTWTWWHRQLQRMHTQVGVKEGSSRGRLRAASAL